MPLIVSGKAPKSGERTATGHKSSALLANQAKAELDRLVDGVIADMDKILPDWETQPEAKAVLTALGELQAQWTAEIAATANKIAAKWVDGVDKNSKVEITSAMRKTLGVDQASILDGVGIKSVVVAMGREAAGLIKSIPSELLSGVADAVAKSYMQEGLPEGRTLAQEIEHQTGHAKKRARFIARDQTQKMHGVVTRTRQAELGVEEFIWRTMRDQRVVGKPGGLYPAASTLHGNHYDREGKRYRWDNLPADGAPGWPIGCRCYAEPVIDLDKLDLIEVSPPTMGEVKQAEPKQQVKASPEPFAGYRDKIQEYLDKLVEQDKEQADAQALYDGSQMAQAEFEATLARIKKQTATIKGQLTKLKAKGLKEQAKQAPVTVTTKPVDKPKVDNKPPLVAKSKPEPATVKPTPVVESKPLPVPVIEPAPVAPEVKVPESKQAKLKDKITTQEVFTPDKKSAKLGLEDEKLSYKDPKVGDDVHTVVNTKVALNNDDKQALWDYTGEDYRAINRYAYLGKHDRAEELKAKMDKIDAAIDKSDVDAPITVYRGITGMQVVTLMGLKEGDTLTLPGYSSVSSSKSEAMKFSGGTMQGLMQITIPRGAKAISVYNNKVSQYPLEMEILLPRNSHFQVVKNGKKGLILKMVRAKE